MRQTWDDYFLEIARVVSTRSTCPRAQVGAIIVKDRRIVATGYNGSATGESHCLDVGCLMIDDHCQRAIHAETNAVCQAAKLGTPINGAILYYWDSLNRPSTICVKCSQVMRAAGIVSVIGKDNSSHRLMETLV